LPFLVVVLVLIHLALLHSYTSTNPLGLDPEIKLSFHYSFMVKDFILFIIILFIFFLFRLLFGYNFIDPENFIEANPLVTPKHIQPE